MADTEEIVKNLFIRGYAYEEIIEMLLKYHDIHMSLRTLKRRLREWNLTRKNVLYDINIVRNTIIELLDGPDSLVGYRSIWHTLRLKEIIVPRKVVQDLLKELDPEGVERRKRHRLHRREYHCAGPNAAWHGDGYDKLKPFGFPIHGCIDGFSRKVLWMYVTRSNNYPDNIACNYLNAVEEFGACPQGLDTDLGTENGTMAGIHSFFTNNPDSHRYVPSYRNQRIECWWSFFRKNWSSWWIDLFKDMVETGILNTADELHTECLWFCFANLLQKDVDRIKESWNTHYIRRSRHDTIAGRPDVLYNLPERYGGDDNLIVQVPSNYITYAYSHLTHKEENNVYQEYFTYVFENLGVSYPDHWRKSLELYSQLLDIAINGY